MAANSPAMVYSALPFSRDPAARLLVITIVLSICVHAVLIALNFSFPKASLLNNFSPPLEVILVNSKTVHRPTKAEALAQANLDGGGNTDAAQRAKSPLPPAKKDVKIQLANRVAQLETKAKKLMTQIDSRQQIDSANNNAQQRSQKRDAPNVNDLMEQSLELARSRAQISKEWNEYQKRPRRRFIGARTQEYRFAQYLEDWRIKVERVGNLNYPESARAEKIHGTLLLTVSIWPDGSVSNIEVDRSSGFKVLDAAAVRIVKLAAPFGPFPPDIQSDTDILSITRTWTFNRADQLVSE